MHALQKERPRHAPTWGGGKNQFQTESFLHQDGEAVNACVRCAYFQKRKLDKRTARICPFNGKEVYGRFLEVSCPGFHRRQHTGEQSCEE